MDFVGTAWAILPPLIAITLALITKEVYMSLFVGIVSGALLYSGFSIIGATESIFAVMTNKLSDSWNIGILIFLVFLGIIVTLMNKAGGSQAYARWANGKIKTRTGALLSTFVLGIFIFVDDYFNCLTVGSVMRPVTDKFNISREKLAYIIDSTAAPICIIAPISSWAAAVSGYTDGDGFTLFLKTIPFNIYALLTMGMVAYVAITNFNFGPMKKYEDKALAGELIIDNAYEQEEIISSDKGKVIDLVLPVVFLIMSSIVGLLYTGGFFSGVDLITAFAECDASLGLVYGAFITLIFMFVLYIPRKVISFNDFAACIPQGFKTMAGAIIILILAWTLGSFCANELQAGVFVSNLIQSSSISLALLPAVLFVVSALLAFSTGTSWGTFSILIPIVTAVFTQDSTMLVIAISAILAGAVCGDHISPISDTTIMASAGARAKHINHVQTQIPYALIVAGASFVGYIVAGATQSVIITLISSIVTLVGIVGIIKLLSKKVVKN